MNGESTLTGSDDFDLVLANTQESLEDAFRLRYQVYCLEKGFEEGQDFKETDEFDKNSFHVLLRHRRSGEAIGTVRIVCPADEDGLEGLPMSRVCAPEFMRHLPLRTTGEISRFALSKQRRLSCQAGTKVRLGLMQGVLQLSCKLGLTHWCAVMEPTLLRLLRASSIHFEPLGPPVEYHGMRQPAALEIAATLARAKLEQPDAWRHVSSGGNLWRNLTPDCLAA